MRLVFTSFSSDEAVGMLAIYCSIDVSRIIAITVIAAGIIKFHLSNYPLFSNTTRKISFVASFTHQLIIRCFDHIFIAGHARMPVFWKLIFFQYNAGGPALCMPF